MIWEKKIPIPKSAAEDLVESQSGADLESQIRAESPLSLATLDLVKVSWGGNPGSRRHEIGQEVFPESGRLVGVAVAAAADESLCTFWERCLLKLSQKVKFGRSHQ